MITDPRRHHRRSIRLKGYDYAQAGAYFVTVVTQDRECLLGEIVDDAMRLNPFGEIVQACNERRNTPGVPVWQRNYYEHVVRGEYDLNHIREYISDNPLRWVLDRENPDAGVRQ